MLLKPESKDDAVVVEAVRKATNDPSIGMREGHFYNSEGNFPFEWRGDELYVKTCEFCDCLIDDGTQCAGCWHVATRLLRFCRRPKGLEFATYIVRGAMAEKARNEGAVA